LLLNVQQFNFKKGERQNRMPLLKLGTF